MKIAFGGYGSGLSSLVAFFPFYPFLIALVSRIGISDISAAFFINYISLCVAAYYLFRLTEHFLKDRESAYRAVFVFLFFPATIFTSIIYTEAIFCALSFAGLYYAIKDKWLLSAVLISAVATVRSPGLLVMATAVFEYCRQRTFSFKRLDRQAYYLLLLPVGFLLMLLYNYERTGNALIFMEIYKVQWTYRHFDPNIPATVWSWIHTWISALRARDMVGIVEQGTIVLSVFAALLLPFFQPLRKFPTLVFYSVISALFLTSFSTSESVNRYILPIFPLYIFIAAKLRTEQRRMLWVGISASLFGICLAILSTGRWAG